MSDPKTFFADLDPLYFKDRDVPVEEILHWFKLCGAAWMHSGDSKDPHAELTSGKCSNGFFNCLGLLKYVTVSEILANQLARKIRNTIGDQKIDWVVASPMAGITFGHDVARALDADIFMFTEKDPHNKGVMLWNRVVIPEGATVFQVEELITTSKTLNAVQKAVDKGNPTPVKWLPYIGSFVHRPPQLPIKWYGNRQLITLVEQEVWAVDPADCPLCQRGSPRYKPKTHWEELTKV